MRNLWRTFWCILWHRAAWQRHDVLRALAICGRCGCVHAVANGYLAGDHQAPIDNLDLSAIYQPTRNGRLYGQASTSPAALGTGQAIKEGWGRRG